MEVLDGQILEDLVDRVNQIRNLKLTIWMFVEGLYSLYEDDDKVFFGSYYEVTAFLSSYKR